MAEKSAEALERARRVRLMLFDVDGVLTDGRLWYGPQGEALKVFHSLDGLGVKLLQQGGIAAGILSGRSSPAVALRAAELGIVHVLQGIEDKLPAFDALLARCGFACAPREAHESVLRGAHYVAGAPAGGGAAREVCDYLLRAHGRPA